MKMIPIAIATAALLLVSGCGITAPQDLGHAYKFTLSSVEPASRAGRKLGNLQLDFPKANVELDTYRIAILRDGGKRDYFAGARWADFLPVILQSTMVESLQNSGRFRAVASDNANFSPDYQLQGDITAFHADYTQSALPTPPTVVVKIRMTLVNVQSQRVIKSFTINKKQVAEANTITAIHRAFDTAFAATQKNALKHIVGALR